MDVQESYSPALEQGTQVQALCLFHPHSCVAAGAVARYSSVAAVHYSWFVGAGLIYFEAHCRCRVEAPL